jgi:F0F1-type ATP synthase membrane subunit c/vacuolar-type H+-ATPase subunit K
VVKKILSAFCFLLFALPGSIFAVGGIATSYKISDTNAVAGDIIVSNTTGLVRSASEYEPHIFGVLTDTATLVVRNVDTTYKPIIQFGTAVVNVSGGIKKGDYVTTSKTAGKGQKATISGYVVGTALEDSAGGRVTIMVNPEYAEISNARTLSRLLDYFTAGLFRNISDQGQFPKVMRYIIAGLIMLICAIISFVTFGRSVPKAIEAIGRNPLARGSILFSLAMSIALIIGILIIGLVASVVILRL